jgi:hypothetical protein
VTDLNPAGRQHLLNHAEAQWKAEVHPDREADHLGIEAVAGVERRAELLRTPTYRGARSHFVNVTMPINGCSDGATALPQFLFTSLAMEKHNQMPGALL